MRFARLLVNTTQVQSYIGIISLYFNKYSIYHGDKDIRWKDEAYPQERRFNFLVFSFWRLGPWHLASKKGPFDDRSDYIYTLLNSTSLSHYDELQLIAN
jgi:hypothetical protein